MFLIKFVGFILRLFYCYLTGIHPQVTGCRTSKWRHPECFYQATCACGAAAIRWAGDHVNPP